MWKPPVFVVVTVLVICIGLCIVVGVVGSSMAKDYQALLEKREKHRALPALEKVEVIETKQFVTFHCVNPADAPWLKNIEVAQEAAEQWMQQHSEYTVRNTSTALSRGRFCVTLMFEKKEAD